MNNPKVEAGKQHHRETFLSPLLWTLVNQADKMIKMYKDPSIIKSLTFLVSLDTSRKELQIWKSVNASPSAPL